jgi:3-oxoadipate enol-lactonase
VIETPTVKVNDITIYYEIKGDGPKLLFISGTGSDLRNPRVGSFVNPLAEKFTVLAYDQRGLGQTEKPDIPYTMSDYANDAAGLLAS